MKLPRHLQFSWRWPWKSLSYGVWRRAAS